MAPERSTLMVSILDLEERLSHRLPRLGGYRSVLSLSFEDTAEETKLAEPGSWADEPEDDDHLRFSQGRGEKIPSLSDAKKIHAFVKKHHDSEESLDFVVHCKAGVSRSAAVAKWVVSFTGAPMCESVKMSTEHANPRVLRLLEQVCVLERSLARGMRP